MTMYVGIDPASKKMATVLSHDRGDGIETNVSKATSDVLSNRLKVLGEDICDFIFQYATHETDDVVVYIEAPVVGRSVRATLVQAQAQGAVIAALARRFGIPVYEVNNKSWKKSIVGNGNAGKDLVAEWVHENHPHFTTTDQDLIDAFCIMLYAKERYGIGERIREGVSGADVA